ncbi:MAG: DUF4355 domain-containing protein [Hominilimicola sp.]
MAEPTPTPEPTPAQEPTPAPEPTPTPEPTPEPEKSFSQSDIDNAVAEALKNADAKSQADFEKRLQEEKTQWEKESKMTAAEREKAAQEKAQKQFEQERSAYQKEKLEFEATKQLAEKKLPVGFAKMVTAMGADSVEDNMKSLETMLSEYRENIVAELTKGKTPKIGDPKTEQFDPFLSGFGI